jgi:glycosyltransferase involved in cell wall biosynthesis
MSARAPAVWFPTLRAHTGADVFTQRLCDGLNAHGIKAQIEWLPLRAEELPWTVRVPRPPEWANIVHVNASLHRRFVPRHLAMVATIHHSVHDPLLQYYKRRKLALYHRFWLKPLESWNLRRANAMTTVSRYTAQKTCEHFGIEAPQVIHPGVTMPEPGSFQRDGTPHGPFRLLFVGSWSKRKGVDLLRPIMEQLGEGFELRYTAEMAKATLPANCRCLGRPDEQGLRQAYVDADALLFPTRLEGFGQVALEAMAYGLPVITTNGSALPEVVEDGVSGILCPQDDTGAFAAAARRLQQDRELWSSMSRAAMLQAHRPEFSMGSMVAGYTRVYQAVREAAATQRS